MGSDPEVEALRELREETGFVGRVVGSSGPLKVNVGMSNDDSQYIFSAEIDETDPRNQHPQQDLEPSEEIEIVLLTEDEIPAFLAERAGVGSNRRSGCLVLVWSTAHPGAACLNQSVAGASLKERAGLARKG